MSATTLKGAEDAAVIDVGSNSVRLVVYRIDPSRVRYMREWALEYQEVRI